jgi:superfamily II DNA/RNA helicase
MQALEKIKTLGIRLVVCTDLLARGIDLPDVRVIVNLDPAQSKEEKLHRMGRACRWNTNPGLCLNFTQNSEKAST